MRGTVNRIFIALCNEALRRPWFWFARHPPALPAGLVASQHDPARHEPDAPAPEVEPGGDLDQDARRRRQRRRLLQRDLRGRRPREPAAGGARGRQPHRPAPGGLERRAHLPAARSSSATATCSSRSYYLNEAYTDLVRREAELSPVGVDLLGPDDEAGTPGGPAAGRADGAELEEKAARVREDQRRPRERRRPRAGAHRPAAPGRELVRRRAAALHGPHRHRGGHGPRPRHLGGRRRSLRNKISEYDLIRSDLRTPARSRRS